jgi:hypothetical protein
MMVLVQTFAMDDKASKCYAPNLIFSPSGGKYRLFGEYNIRSNPVILPFSL